MSNRFGQGRDLRFGVIDAGWSGDYLLATVASNMQIKVVSYALSSNSSSPVPFQFQSGATGSPGTRILTGGIQISNNRPPAIMISSPIAHLFETNVGGNLYARINASAYVGGHFSYFYENLAASGQ